MPPKNPLIIFLQPILPTLLNLSITLPFLTMSYFNSFFTYLTNLIIDAQNNNYVFIYLHTHLPYYNSLPQIPI